MIASPFLKKIFLGATSAVAIGLIIFLLLTQQHQSTTLMTTPQSSTDQLITALEKTRLAKPDFKTLIALAQAYLQKIRESADSSLYQKVEDLVAEAEKIEPGNPELSATRALVALGRHDFVEALQLGTKAHDADPENTSYYGIIGDAQIELGRYKEAVATLQTMVDRRPDFASYTRIAYARELYGDSQGAIEAMQAALTAGAVFPENTAWAHTELARLYTNSGKISEAKNELTTALNILPTFAPTERALGYNAFARGEQAEAGQHFQRAVDLLPIDANLTDLADWQALQGEAVKAAQAYQVIQIIFQQSEKNGVNVNLELALFLADHDLNLAEAKTRALAGYKVRPSVHAADVVAWTLYKNKDFAAAEKYSQEALRLGTKDPAALYHAAKIAEALGKKTVAEKYLAEVKNLNHYFSLLYSQELLDLKK